MKLSRFIQCMTIITVVALIYINMQIQIYDLAYKGKHKEGQITDLSETNAMVNYNILQLKSSSHLGVELLAKRPDLRFGDSRHTIQLVTMEKADGQKPLLTVVKNKRTNPFLNFFTSRAEADARTPDKDLVPRP